MEANSSDCDSAPKSKHYNVRYSNPKSEALSECAASTQIFRYQSKIRE
jgi:hypothetical protein